MNTETSAQPPLVQDKPAVARPSGQRWPRLWGPRLWKLLALAIVLTAYRFWVVKHSGISLFFDESQYWDWSRHLSWGYFSKPPLIAAVVWLSTNLFGSGVLGVKAVSMLIYPITAVAMVGLARALWPTSSGVRTGMVAAALFLTTPMVGLLGLVASTDGPLLLCWTLAAWALWRAQVTNRLSLWLLCGLAVGLGIMDKYTMAAFGLTAVWTLWGVHGPKRGLVRVGPWAALIVAALVVAPNLWWNAQHGFPTLLHTAELTAQSGRHGGFLPMITFALGQILMLGPVVVVAALWLLKQAANVSNASIPPSQWAASSQMMPPSQWRPSNPVLPPSQLNLPGARDAAIGEGRPQALRTSAYYLASTSSYRFLWALSIPLLLVALVQSFHADAHVNWAAPAMIGLLMLVASRLSPPLVPLAAPRPNRWLAAALVSNLILTGLVLHAKDIGGDNLPSKYDILVRMRGWQEAYDKLAPTMEEPTIGGLPVLADKRLLLTQTAYHWRRFNFQLLAWNPKGLRLDHYQLMQSMSNRVGQDVVLVTDEANPTHILQRFAIVRKMNHVVVPTGPDRKIELHVFFLRGFLGYDAKSYLEQSGASANDELGGD
ncbi:MAG: glycosyltransferase family 39 protein [Rubrivivax sp.]|nr:MAG: glycosyltransferase family 39 protein [Rubrivivax sp.]